MIQREKMKCDDDDESAKGSEVKRCKGRQLRVGFNHVIDYKCCALGIQFVYGILSLEDSFCQVLQYLAQATYHDLTINLLVLKLTSVDCNSLLLVILPHHTTSQNFGIRTTNAETSKST